MESRSTSLTDKATQTDDEDLIVVGINCHTLYNEHIHITQSIVGKSVSQSSVDGRGCHFIHCS